jgi:hypothetical protein
MYGYYVHFICVCNVISFVYDIINVFAPHVLLIVMTLNTSMCLYI